jgi:hypothetical protein
MDLFEQSQSFFLSLRERICAASLQNWATRLEMYAARDDAQRHMERFSLELSERPR